MTVSRLGVEEWYLKLYSYYPGILIYIESNLAYYVMIGLLGKRSNYLYKASDCKTSILASTDDITVLVESARNFARTQLSFKDIAI